MILLVRIEHWLGETRVGSGANHSPSTQPPEFSVHNGERFWMYAESDPFDIPANGRSASGTATLVESGAMDAQTGEIETTPFEASLEISC